MRPAPFLSVVVPCFNEAQVLQATHDRLVAALTGACPFEIIYVDDGSRDATWETLADLQETDDRVRALRLSRNFGHQVAATAGLDAATGDAVVLIDADLQDPPDVIPAMVRRWREGYDVAYGRRLARDGESVFKLGTASAFYRIFNAVATIEAPLDTGDFRLLDRKVVDALGTMREGHRFLRGMVSWLGFRQIAVPYHRAARAAGHTKYPLRRMLRLATDGILSFSTLPLRLATVAGALACLAGMGGLLASAVLRVAGGAWPSATAAVLIAIAVMGGLQLLCLGIAGEYLGRIYVESCRRPLYALAERRGFAAESAARTPRAGRPGISPKPYLYRAG